MLKIITPFLILIFSMGVFAKRESLEKSKKDNLLKLYIQNEKLHAAFFKYNGEEIVKEAKRLKEKMLSLKDKELRDKFKLAVKMLDRLEVKADKKENNKAYQVASMALVNILNKYDLGDTYNVYYCPMLKVMWIQNSKKMEEVHNPYADYMPHCGRKFSDY